MFDYRKRAEQLLAVAWIMVLPGLEVCKIQELLNA